MRDRISAGEIGGSMFVRLDRHAADEIPRLGRRISARPQPQDRPAPERRSSGPSRPAAVGIIHAVEPAGKLRLEIGAQALDHRVSHLGASVPGVTT
jgi:hypothetical protein